MFAYWFLFACFGLTALSERIRQPGDFRTGAPLLILAFFSALMIGLRFHVGADYETYQQMFALVTRQKFDLIFEWGDPGYQLLSWLIGQADGKYWHLNLVCGTIFCWGLVRLASQQPSPVLAALVAVPYLLIVVAMGYTRQAVAIGFIMAGLASLQRGSSVIRFALYVAAAALFHRTAVIVLPLAIFAGRRNHFLNGLAVLAMALGLYNALLAEDVSGLVKNYIDARYSSQGAGIRVAMNIVPALLIFFAGDRLGLTDYERRLWRIFSFIAIATVPALFLVPSTTAIDRIALYLLPIQIVGIGRAIMLARSPHTARLAVVGYCALVLFVWLNFAAHSRAWVPYRTVPIF